ncbi:MAG TPA: TadE family protein [Microbacteriaceae bacterium]|nr:TadE family protein [Microbacteriaceae bacterium]
MGARGAGTQQHLQRRHPTRPRTLERGSAPVDFVLVSMLIVTLTIGLIQLGLAFYVRNTLIDAAAEGARFASLADVQPSEGVDRTRRLIRDALGTEYADRVWLTEEDDVVAMHISAHLPLVGLIGIDRTLEVAGHAVREHLD